MAKSGGLFKLDAICDKLKTNLKSKSITDHSNERPDHVQQNGISVGPTNQASEDEPNNNTDTLDVLKEINIALTNHDNGALGNNHDATNITDCVFTARDHENPEEKSSGSRSRRNRRKAQNPRNISNLTVEQAKDELADYEVNNPGVDFSSICEAAMEEEDDGDDGCDQEWDDSLQICCDNENYGHSDSELSQLSGDGISRSSNLCEASSSEKKAIYGEAVDAASTADCGILDLSMSHAASSRCSPPSGMKGSADDKSCNGMKEENGVLNLSLASRDIPSKSVAVKSEFGPNSSKDEVEMKDYAENTMNELLSMYGLTDEGTSDSSGINLKNFDSELYLRKRHLHNINMSRGKQFFDQPSLKKLKVESEVLDDKVNHSSGLIPIRGRSNHCEDMAYKEHFHCLDCSFRVFIKKEEMIRHFKWHKKRDESLQHGFMRYSPMDDCSKKFPGTCTHNGKQTHYHCLQVGCSKVYISTSDVQMHANYHRKDSAILQEGFQRFRATEDCATPSCSFYNQRTTHFHCRRLGCTFTFKNKADMEKHKAYHQKDEMLTKDGFKKFMKYEHCSFVGCRYSKTSNHIHCIRPGCHYVLHSTGQLYSHKRRHERANYDSAYRHFKISPNKTQSLTIPQQQILPCSIAGFSDANTIKTEGASGEDFTNVNHPLNVSVSETSSSTSEVLSHGQDMSMTSLPSTPGDPEPGIPTSAAMKIESADCSPEHKVPSSTIAKLVSKLSNHPLNDSLTLPIPGQSAGSVNSSLTEVGVVTSPSSGSVPLGPNNAVRAPSPTTAVGPGGFVPKVSPPVNEKKERDESWKKFLTRYTANDPCHSRCQFLYKDHYHCNTVNCGMLFRSKDRVREHAKLHEQQERITSLTFMVYEENVSCSDNCQYNRKEKHYHCLWADCKHVISAGSDPVFSRMEHYKLHEYSRAAQGRRLSGSSPIVGTSPGLKRRRGRPPKYQRKEITQVPKIEMTDEQILTQARLHGPDHCISSGFKKFTPSDPCPDEKCIFAAKGHYHCIRQRCHHATDNTDLLSLHAKDFHSYIHILEGFEFFDRTVNCRRPHCHNNKATRHFHCVRPNCDYSFVRVSTMAQHDKKHRMAEMGLTHSPTIAVPTMAFLSNKTVPIMPMSVTHAQQMVSIAPAGLVRATNTHFPTTASNTCTLSAGIVQVTQTAPIMVAMPPRHPQPSHGMTSSGSIQPIIIAPVTTTLPVTSMSKLIPTHAGPLVNTGVTAPLIFKSAASSSQLLPVTAHMPLMASPVIKPVDSSMTFTPQLITIAPKPVTGGGSVTSNKPIPATISNNQPGLTVLLQQKVPKVMPQTSWVNLLVKMHCSPNQNCGRPFCKLKKKDHFHCFDCNQAFSDPLRLKTHVTKHGFHVDKSDMLQGRVVPLSDQLSNVPAEEMGESCSDGEENSNSLNLVPGTFSKLFSKGFDQDNVDSDSLDVVMDLSLSANRSSSPREANTAPQEAKSAAQVNLPATSETDPESARHELLQSLGLIKRADESASNEIMRRRSTRKCISKKNEDFIKTDESTGKLNWVGSPQPSEVSPKPQISDHAVVSRQPCSMKTQIPSSSHSVTSDHSLPSSTPPTSNTSINPPITEKEGSSVEGYRQYKYNEDCQFERCAYRQSQSHYHCSQNNCGYAFCDLSRWTQHSERHRRLINLMGDEFEEYRASVDCARPDCEFSRKSTHFHCLKCPFICKEAIKVTAHRTKPH